MWLGRLIKREFQHQFRSRWSQRSQPWDTTISLGTYFLQSTSQWFDQQWLSRRFHSLLLHPKRSCTLTPQTQAGAPTSAPLPPQVSGGTTYAGHKLLPQTSARIRRLLGFAPRKVREGVHGQHHGRLLLKQAGGHAPGPCPSGQNTSSCGARPGTSRCQQNMFQAKIYILADSPSRAHSVIHTEWTLAHFAF